MAKFFYFSGTTEVSYYGAIRNAEFAAKFPGVKGKRSDSFSMLVGRNAAGELQPVTRVIEFKKNPSLHKCSDKCRSAKGGSCECSCRGQFHGAGDISEAA
jgi:hypothetical protein